MNRVPVMMQNPAYVEEVEPDVDGFFPANIMPLISGDTHIVTIGG